MGNKKTTLIHGKSLKPSSNSAKILLDDIIIVWLHENHQNILSKFNFRQLVDSIQTFSNENLCEHYLKNEINDKQRVFLIISDRFAEEFLPRIHHLSPIESIYLFSPNENRYEFLSIKYSKLNENIFSKISELNQKLKQDLDHCQNDLIKIDLTHDQSNKLEPSFMYSQLLKETLINIEYDQNSKKSFVDYCLQHSYPDQIEIIQEFADDYEKHSPIWWYTRECFVYEKMNKAFRTQNIEVLIQMGFFIRDLHREIEKLYSTQEHSSMVVYRGQGMTNNLYEKLCHCKGGLISFQSFLSTSREKHVSLNFARRAVQKPGLRGIIYRMKIDPNLMNRSSPYASINNFSYFQNSENEILFSTHTVFRIGDIRPIKGEKKIWQVNLRLTTNEDDEQLQQLTQHLRKNLQPSANPQERLGKLLLDMEKFDIAEEIFENILAETSENENKQLAYIYHQLGCVHNGKKNFDEALEYFHQSLNIKAEESQDPQLADLYLNIGSIYHAQGKLDEALNYFNQALQTNTEDRRILAPVYNNIGMVYKRQGQFSNALAYFEKGLEIDLENLPPVHPDLARSYSNIGRVYSALKDYANALSYYKKTLDICHSSLPQNHSLLLRAIVDYENVSTILSNNHFEPILSAPMPPKRRHSFHLKLFGRSKKLVEKVSAKH